MIPEKTKHNELFNIERLEYLMDTYPNLYFDISFGEFANKGLLRISQNVDKYKHFYC